MGVDGLLSVAHNVLSTDHEYFHIYIDGVEDQVFSLQTEQVNDVVQSISSLLAKAGTRAVGVRLLKKYLDQCSTEVFIRTGNLWTSLVLKSCQGEQDCSDAYGALAKLAIKSLQTPELTKTFATTHLSKVYECLTNPSNSCVVSALACLETCLRLYPSASGPSKRILEKFLGRFRDSLDNSVISFTGKCLHLLQQVSGGEAQSSNHKTLWKNYQTQLVGSIHEVFDAMFVHCAEMWDDNVVQERLVSMDEMELSPEPISKAAQLYVRSHNLISYFITALKEPFPVEKPLLPRMILGVITRGLGVNCNMLHQNSITDNIALALLLPKVHLDLLHLLDVVITVLRGHLLPYYNQILGLLMEVVKSTAEDENYVSNQKPFRRLRAKVYDTLSLWCKVHNAGSRCEAITDQLFQEILNDITPKSNELTLQVTKAVSKHTSKKMKRQMQKAQNDRSKIVQSSLKCNRTLNASYNDEQNQLLCAAALKCLQAVLTSAASFIKPTKIKLMQSSLIQICVNFYEMPMDAGQLYGNSHCRLEIYNTLYVFITTPHHLSPPPADILLALLNAASYRDGNMKVRGQCLWILQNLEKLIHPQKESLVFPIDAREIRNTFIMMGQQKLLEQTEKQFTNNGLNEAETDDENEDMTDESLERNESELKQSKAMETEDIKEQSPVQNDQQKAIELENSIVSETEDIQVIDEDDGEKQAAGESKKEQNESALKQSKDMETEDMTEQSLKQNDQQKAIELEKFNVTDTKDIQVIDEDDAEKQAALESKENYPESPQTISDSDCDSILSLSRPSVKNTSDDDTVSLKLRIDDQDSDQDDVQIISVEPLNKKSRIEKEQKADTIYIDVEENVTARDAKEKAATESEEIEIVDGTPNTSKQENVTAIDVKEKAATESEKTENVDGTLNTGTDDSTMNLDGDALVEVIAAQFVDDLA